MGQTDRPDDRRAAGSRLPSNSESAVKRNHETPKSGIPKRKKIEACPRLSCKIQYLLASNHSDQSTASEYFTADELPRGVRLTSLREAVVHLDNTVPSSERSMPVILTAAEMITRPNVLARSSSRASRLCGR